MASTQVARAAAQLHEAALDVARVAALRSTQPQEPTNGPQVPLQLGLTEDEDGGDGPVAAETVAGEMALVLAAKPAEHGYRVMFPPGRDAAAFKVTGLPGSPGVEVIAEYNGSAACHYTAAAQRRQPRSSPGSRSPATRRSRPPLLTRSSRRGRHRSRMALPASWTASSPTLTR